MMTITLLTGAVALGAYCRGITVLWAASRRGEHGSQNASAASKKQMWTMRKPLLCALVRQFALRTGGLR